MGSWPGALLAEVRVAFRSCSRQHAAGRRTTRFSTLHPRLHGNSGPRKNDDLPIQVVHRRAKRAPSLPKNGPDGTELVPRSSENALDGGRKVDVPMRVIPKAEIAPNLTLSPKERLHIEQLTRRLPPRVEPRVYKRRLRIYTAGNGRIYMLTFLRFAAILGLTFVTVIVAPAHWVNGSPLLVVAGIWLAGFIPFVYINWTLRPMVTEIFLALPPAAQHSPKGAMEYAKGLPADATLELRFMRALGVTDVVSLKLASTRPARSLFRPVSFEWVGPSVDRGSFLRPNPTHFDVRPHSAGGKAARDVTPNVWTKVYQRLTGVESGVVSKWRR